MQFNEFQSKALESAVYPRIGDNFVYPALGLAGEVGEVMELVKKAIRDDSGFITPERREKLRGELGDVQWYLAALARELDLPLDDIATGNLAKLSSRKERGVLHGSGSDR